MTINGNFLATSCFSLGFKSANDLPKYSNYKALSDSIGDLIKQESDLSDQYEEATVNTEDSQGEMALIQMELSELQKLNDDDIDCCCCSLLLLVVVWDRCCLHLLELFLNNISINDEHCNSLSIYIYIIILLLIYIALLIYIYIYYA